MHYISDTLYWISTGLLVPVIVLLILLFLRSLLLIGKFFGQYQQLRRDEHVLETKIGSLRADGLDRLLEELPAQTRSPMIRCIRQLLENRNSRAVRDRLIADFEAAAEQDLAPSRTLSKMGPMLGLMGTLIPMGPALVGLSSGDIASMAYNMQVAFATTVVGLFAAAVGFITLQTKERWYRREISRLDFISDLTEENSERK